MRCMCGASQKTIHSTRNFAGFCPSWSSTCHSRQTDAIFISHLCSNIIIKLRATEPARPVCPAGHLVALCPAPPPTPCGLANNTAPCNLLLCSTAYAVKISSFPGISHCVYVLASMSLTKLYSNPDRLVRFTSAGSVKLIL